MPAPGVVAKRVAFVVNRGSALPDVALALQQRGDGIIVAEGAIDDSTGAPPIDGMREATTSSVRRLPSAW